MLIDAGPAPRAVADWLRRSGTDTVHLAIATHNHADHIGGMAGVLGAVAVLNYMENGMATPTRTYARMVTLLEERGTPVLRAERRLIDLGGGASLRVLGSMPRPRTQNDASIGLELTYGNFRVFFAGDAEEKQRGYWAGDSIRRVQVLKVSHHGSINGTDARMLGSLRPCTAIVSVGARNQFGHPSRAVLRLLDGSRITTIRTDLAGDIVVTADSSGAFQVTTKRSAQRVAFTPTCEVLK